MKRIKNVVAWILIIVFGYLLISRRSYILTQINYYFNSEDFTSGIEVNEYYRDYDFAFVQNTKDFIPGNKQDILNIYYTFINSGNTSFTFLCPLDYLDCLDEVEILAGDRSLVSAINNFVHPLNSFHYIETSYDNFGNVTITLEKNYSETEIKSIEAEIDRLSLSLINPNQSDITNIKRIHDYIINNTKYDSDRTDKGLINYKSHIAYGPLFQGYGICGGYTDLMALFLEELAIKNYRVASDTHTWNALYINGGWTNLDLTWDDPVTNTGTDVLIDDFFMISTNTLLTNEPEEHNFNPNIYRELN